MCRGYRFPVRSDSPETWVLGGRYGPDSGGTTRYGGVEFVNNWKAASSSLAIILKCKYGAEQAPGSSAIPLLVSAMAIRHPIERFVSAVLELLKRAVNNRCPGHRACCNARGGCVYSGAWHKVLLETRQHGPGERFAPQRLLLLLESFVMDAACCGGGYGMEHLASQSTFAFSAQRGIDVLINLSSSEQASAGLAEVTERMRLGRGVGGHKDCGDLQSIHENSQATSFGQPRAQEQPLHDYVPVMSNTTASLPSTATLLAALYSQPHLVDALASVYMQDFACFGFTIPHMAVAHRNRTSDCNCAWAAHGCAKNDGSRCWLACCYPHPITVARQH